MALFQPAICHCMFLDSLFDSFDEETILDCDYIRNYGDVGKLNSETGRDRGNIID